MNKALRKVFFLGLLVTDSARLCHDALSWYLLIQIENKKYAFSIFCKVRISHLEQFLPYRHLDQVGAVYPYQNQ